MKKQIFILILLFLSIFSIFTFSNGKKIITFFVSYNPLNTPIPTKNFEIKIDGKRYPSQKIIFLKGMPKNYMVALGNTGGIAKNFGNIIWFNKGLISNYLFDDNFHMYLYSPKGVRILVPPGLSRIEIEKKFFNFLPYMLFNGVFEKNFKNISPLKNKNLNPLENCIITLSKVASKYSNNAKKSIIIFTDGTYKINKEKVKDFFKNPIQTFFIYISDKKSRYFKSICSFAKIAGGKVYFVPSKANILPSICNNVNFIIENTYMIEIDPEEFKGKKIDIKIKLKNLKGITLSYPKFIYK